MGSVMVCGFYTEDYRRWLIPLVSSLDRLGQAGHYDDPMQAWLPLVILNRFILSAVT